MFDDILMLLKLKLDLSVGVYGLIIILAYGIVWQQYARQEEERTML